MTRKAEIPFEASGAADCFTLHGGRDRKREVGNGKGAPGRCFDFSAPVSNLCRELIHRRRRYAAFMHEGAKSCGPKPKLKPTLSGPDLYAFGRLARTNLELCDRHIPNRIAAGLARACLEPQAIL